MKVVILQQFRPTELEHVGMHRTLRELCFKPSCSLCGFGKGCGSARRSQLPVMAEFITAKRQDEVELVSSYFKAGLPPCVAGWCTSCINEPHHTVAALLFLLAKKERLEETFPFCNRRLGIVDLACPQELANLRSGEAALGLTEDLTNSF